MNNGPMFIIKHIPNLIHLGLGEGELITHTTKVLNNPQIKKHFILYGDDNNVGGKLYLCSVGNWIKDYGRGMHYLKKSEVARPDLNYESIRQVGVYSPVTTKAPTPILTIQS